jgi:hypothetical protein
MNDSKPQIPINTRTVGNPDGHSIKGNILYIEDYVHTFLNNIIQNGKSSIKISLFGNCTEENGVLRFVISGAGMGKADASFFPSCNYLCNAIITKKREKENNLRLELYSRGVISVIEDYYIYYDQNEEMQNYLINWNSGNTQEAKTKVKECGSEEAKVSFMWNIMNALCLGFLVCFMAYGIITINNYSKMQSLQSSIDYCMKILDSQLAYDEESTIEDIALKDIVIEDIATIEESAIEGTSIEETSIEENTEKSVETINKEIPQYYIVQQGDTLRSICYEIYGDYDYIEKVCLWNDIDDPNNILCGQKLLLR